MSDRDTKVLVTEAECALRILRQEVDALPEDQRISVLGARQPMREGKLRFWAAKPTGDG